MENLIIYLAIAVIIFLIVLLAKAYKTSNTHKANFEQKVKELDLKDNTINTQKSELANRKDQIEAQKKLTTKATEDLELVKAGLESCREDQKQLKAENQKLQENYKLELSGFYNEKEALQQKITTLEEENQQLLTQLNTKKNGKRNPKN